MNYVDLPDVRHVVRGFKLRVDAARAVSQVELLAASGAASVEAAESLRDFFVAAANAADKAAGGNGKRVKVSK